MATSRVLDVRAYGGRTLHPRFMQQEAGSDHLALLFPGRGYSCDMPLLYYAALLMHEAGADTLRVDHDYATNRPLAALSEEEADKCLEADVSAIYAAAFAERAYKRVTLIGKSLGVIALSLLPRAQPLPSDTRAVWLTPPLRHAAAVARIEEVGLRSLVVIGTADVHYDDALVAHLAEATGGRSLVLQGADHSLEVPGDFARTLRVLTAVAAAIAEFCAD